MNTETNITYKLDEQENVVEVRETTTTEEVVVDIHEIDSQIESLNNEFSKIEEDYTNEVAFVEKRRDERNQTNRELIEKLIKQKEEITRQFPHKIDAQVDAESVK